MANSYKAVIYKSLGYWYITTEDNYNATIQDVRKVHRMEHFNDPREIAEYVEKYLKVKPEDIKVINENKTEIHKPKINRYLLTYFDGDVEIGEDEHKSKLFVAPTQTEAIEQCYAYMQQMGINGDIISAMEVVYNFKEYMDTETGEILYEDELYKEYLKTYPTREITFLEHIKNCTDKNGTLELVKIIKEYEWSDIS